MTYADSEILTTKDKLVKVDKAIKDLNHKNTIGLEEGVKKTIEWMRSYYNISDHKVQNLNVSNNRVQNL